MSNLEDTYRVASALPPEERLRLIVRLWASLPSEHWAAPTSDELIEASRRLSDFNAGRRDEPPWEVVPTVFDLAEPVAQVVTPAAKTYSAPRRFDLATIFVVTAAYAILFAILRALRTPPIAMAYIALFITIVGTAQPLLFGGAKPRLASVVAGIAAWFVAFVSYAFMYPLNGPRQPPASPGAILATALFSSGLFGIPCGYIAGTLVGGLFLVADVVRKRYGRELDEQGEEITLEVMHSSERVGASHGRA